MAVLLLIIIYIAFVNLGLPDSLLGSSWPLMHRDLAVPLHYAGVIAMIISGGTVVSSILSGVIIRRTGTGLLTAISVAVTGAALVGFSCSRDFFMLCLFALPLGLGAGAVDAALNNYVALHFKAKHMSWLHCFWGIGAATGPVILSAYFANGASWQAGYRLIGLMQFGMAAILFAALPLWKMHRGTAETVLKPPAPPVSARPLRLIMPPGLKLTLAAFFCYCSVESMTGLWGSTYLVTVRQITPGDAARCIAFFYGGITFGRFICGFLTLKLNNRQMIWFGLAVTACGLVMLCLPATVMLRPAFFLIGLGFAPVYPSLLHETPRSFGSEESQSVIGLQMACAYMGTMLMPPLFGRIAGALSWTLYPAAIALVFAVKAVLLAAAFRTIDRNRRP